MKKALVMLGLLVSSFSYSQATNGMSGLIHIPSARMLDDGQLILGVAYIPKGFFSSTSGPNRYLKVNPGLNTYITYGILPFVEVMFRYSHELKMKVNVQTRYFPDRMLGIRARLFDEKKLLPSVVFGFQDASAFFANTCLSCSNFSATYFVSSKNFKFDFGDFDISIGYAFDLFELKSKDFKSVFGGLLFTPNFYNRISFSIEHNSKVINSGIKWNPFKSINLMIGIWDLNKPTFSLNYLF